MQPIVLYLPFSGPRRNELIGALAEALNRTSFSIIRDRESLEHTLRHSISIPSIVVLVLPTLKDLEDIASIRDVLSQINVILALPNEEPDTMAFAHSIRPRFVTLLEDDFRLLSDVLTKMVREVPLTVP